MPIGQERVVEKSHQVAARLFASRNRRPDAFAPGTALFAPCSLRDLAIKDHEPNRLLGKIVRRIDARRRDELEEGGAVIPETIRHVLRLARGGNPPRRQGENRFSGRGQTPGNCTCFQLVGAMKRAEHFANRIEQTLAIRLCQRVRKRRKVLHVADHVSQAKLNTKVHFSHVFSIRAEIIAAELIAFVALTIVFAS